MKTIVIIGGGVAGLAALNQLADLGIAATLIEGGDYPAHKICGEFFSPECLPILEEWNVLPGAEIKKISLIAANSSLHFSLSKPARSQSRFDFDFRLAKRAEEKGAKILTRTKVSKIEKDKVHLDNGEVLLYTDLIVSAGRFFGTGELQYIGIKGHLRGLEVNHLEMFPFQGGYGGLSPIGEGLANFACLIRRNNYTAADPLKMVFESAPQLKRRLENGVLAFDDWMISPIPSFGIKKTPSWDNAYFIGDAAGTIPPASGLGLSLAIASGCMVAGYALKGDFLGFKKDWRKKNRRVFAYGRCLHYAFMTDFISHSAIKIGNLFPSLAKKIFQLTRDSCKNRP